MTANTHTPTHTHVICNKRQMLPSILLNDKHVSDTWGKLKGGTAHPSRATTFSPDCPTTPHMWLLSGKSQAEECRSGVVPSQGSVPVPSTQDIPTKTPSSTRLRRGQPGPTVCRALHAELSWEYRCSQLAGMSGLGTLNIDQPFNLSQTNRWLKKMTILPFSAAPFMIQVTPMTPGGERGLG